ncbi:hypothetical protein A4X20_03485 [Mycolicibacterium iranicum]|uniref:Glycoprotein n=1 Tax=Mycolicibacterium iranicum TaxID=912594 RepID=A0A178M218_MYCIR|nr:hypothetical protein A4X20_03485 [Mycolicibacterium iranicum]
MLVLFVALLLAVTPLAAPPLAASQPPSIPFLRVQIDSITPDTITTTSDQMVTVTGTISNVGDREVRDVVVRLERAPAVTSSSALRTDLAGNVDQYQPVADFIIAAPELARGQQVPFRLAYPLRSAEGSSMRIDTPGVYPFMVNVNGTPDYGAAARLDDSRFLLPVLGVPPQQRPEGGAATEVTATDALESAVPPDTTRPVGLTMFWPLADRPRLAAGAPGGTTPVRLIDDELATSLAPGGRLDTMLTAVDFATSPEVDPGGDVTRALCLAVDPDLLVTVNAMTTGYVVNDAADAGPGTPTHPGAGQQAAIDWMTRLKALARRICVAPTVYAQADLDALNRVADPGLSSIATTGAGGIVDQILGITSTRGASLIGDGPLTASAVQLLAAQGPTVAIGAANLVGPEETADGLAETADTTPIRYTPTVVAAPFDPAVGAALAGVGPAPESPSYMDPSLDVSVKQDSAVARRQNALASLLWRSLHPETTPRTEILMPPLMWDLTPQDAQSILSAVATSIRAGLATPRPLPVLINEANASAKDAPLPTEPLGNPRGRFDAGVVTGIAAATGRLWGLTAALTTDERTGLTGYQYTAPLREDLLRALSLSVPPDARNGLAQQRLTTVGRTVEDLFNAVTIVNPGGSYTLATERSPLPLALRNDLPVPIRVRLDIDAPPGMTVTDMGEIVLPPGFLPLKVPIEVHFTQRVAVDVALRTADGVPLGEPVRLSVHSNAYGKVLFFITLTGGVVLALLVGRRLWHRFRGQPDRADLDRPDPIEVALSYRDDETPADA